MVDSAQSKFVAAGPGNRDRRRVIEKPAVPDRLPGQFRSFFAAIAGSDFGTQISFVALPLTAVLALGAGAAEVGALTALTTAAFLLIGLPAGAWVDRLPRRAVMITTDVVRAVLYGSVPVAWLLGALTMPQLYAVALLGGVATVFSEVAAQTFLPELVGRDHLVPANARLMGARGVNQIIGRSAGGFLASAFAAPVVIALDALSYACSAVVLWRIRVAAPAAPARPGSSVWPDVRDGLHHVLGNRVLRPLAIEGALTNFATTLTITVLPVVFVRELRLDEWVLGVFLAVGGCGALAGAVCARALAARFGYGRVLWIAGVAASCAGCAVPLLSSGSGLWFAAAGWAVLTTKTGIGNVLAVSLRQSITPDHLMGRMNATFRFLLTGALAVGGVLAGALGGSAGARAVLWVSAGVFAVTWLAVFLSPLRSLRSLPEAQEPTVTRVAATR
ncbi:Transmembrane secretion effector [Saccharopolyspora kobensis]|uniref:Transmembrane secretion effector n=1 Tax=Saccharopolyspora kobensis TaxID=146035 RepID=A0A1H6EHC2_9PSEU|nr:Transmembrane secretion effector [Saccharopolyspora kobensis]SFC82166.1 Transmembrane secretion effector [Saccharopolyspora kobensis]